MIRPATRSWRLPRVATILAMLVAVSLGLAAPPREEIARELFSQIDLTRPELREVKGLLDQDQPGAALDRWRDLVVARLRRLDFGEYGWHDYARHPRNTGMVDSLAGRRTRADYLNSNLVGFIDIYGMSGSPGAGPPIQWFTRVEDVTDWGNAEIAARPRDKKLLDTGYGTFEFAKGFVARYWETDDEVYLRKCLEIMSDFARNHKRGYWEAYFAQGGLKDKETGEVYRCDWRLNTNSLEMGWRAKNFMKILAGFAKSLGADKPAQWADVLHPVTGELTRAQLNRLPADPLAEIAVSLVRDHSLKLLWCYIRDGDVPNQRAEGLKSLAFITGLFPEFKVTPLLVEQAEIGYRNFLTSNFLPDGGSLEQSFNYNGQDKEGLEELVKFYGDAPPPFAQLALSKVQARRAVDDGLQTPLGSLPQVGNWHHTHGKDTWSSDEAARRYEAAELESKAPVRPQPYLSTAFPYSGFYAMRSGWALRDLYLFFMNGRPQSGHSMRDNNAVQMMAYGRPLVVCGGPPTYGMFRHEDARGADFYLSEASSLKNNTVLVDGCSQARSGPVAGQAYQTPVAGRWHSSPRYDLVDGHYNRGYSQWENNRDTNVDLSVEHYRQVIFIKAARLWLLTDRMLNPSEKPHQYTQVWKFLPDSPDPDYKKTIAGFKPDQFRLDAAAGTFRTTDPAGPNVEFRHFGPAVAYQKYFGHKDPWRGWFAAGIGDARPAVDVHANWQSTGGDTLLTLLTPLDKGQETPVLAATAVDSADGSITGLQAGLRDRQRLSYLTTATPGRLTGGVVTVQARSLLVCEGPAGQVSGLAIEATALEVKGRRVAGATGDFEFVVDGQGQVTLTPFHLAAVPVIAEPLPFLKIGDLAPVALTGDSPGLDIRYTLDGSEPTAKSPLYREPLRLQREGTLQARYFRGPAPLPLVASRDFRAWPWPPRPPDLPANAPVEPGLEYGFLEHEDSIRLYDLMKRPMQKTGTCPDYGLDAYQGTQRYGMRWRGYLKIPADGLYHFHVDTPVYAYLFLRDEQQLPDWRPLVVSGYQSPQGTGDIALQAGYHRLEIQFMRAWKSENKLLIKVSGPGLPTQPLPAAWLFRPAGR